MKMKSLKKIGKVRK